MKHLRQTFALLLTGVVVTGVAGCGRSSDSTGAGAGPSSASEGSSGDPTKDQTLGSPHRGGTMKVIWEGFGSSIDPGIDYDGNWSLLRMTNDGLLTWKRVPGAEGNTLTADLATAIPTPSEDGLTYEFTLRKGVKYSTGQEVKPSDFKATIERQYKLPGPVANFYSAIKGGEECEATPEAGKACNLSSGIIADDAAMTLTFKLAKKDPDFLQKLALPFAYALPAGTPAEETGVKPLPATGPYMIENYTPSESMVMVRNPQFVQWSGEAQPNGYPDRIEFNLAISPNEGTTQVANGDADYIADQPPADRLEEISSRYQDRIFINPRPQVYHMVLNTQVAPFDT